LKNERVGGYRKVGWLLAAGGAAALLGWLWGLQFPVIKRIWSSSFVLMASGYSAMLLAVFYLIVDVWLWRRWCEPFVWIGTNAITIYLAVNIISFPMLAERLAGGDVKSYLDAHVARGFGGLVVALTGLGLAIALVGFLHRKKIFLRL
jgi:predicted acyltransferase